MANIIGITVCILMTIAIGAILSQIAKEQR